MIDTPPQLSDRLPVIEIIDDLKELTGKLKAQSDRGHQGWKITRCTSILEKIRERDVAAGDQKWDAEKHIQDKLEEICMGYQQASMMHFVYVNSTSDVVEEHRSIFTSGSIPTAIQQAKSGSDETDFLFERFTECLLIKAGCTDVSREVGEQKQVDLLFTHGENEFAAECKRPRSRKKIRDLMSTARGQLMGYSKNTHRIPIICIDCTLPIIKEIKDVVTELRPFLENTEDRIWRAFSSVFHEDMSRDTSNRYFNALGIAMIPYISRDYVPTISCQLLAARNFADTPKSAIDKLFDALPETRGLYKKPHRK